MNSTSTKKTILHEALEKGVRSMLDESNVPMQVHLAIVKQFHEAMQKHGEHTTEWQKTLNEYKQYVDLFERKLQEEREKANDTHEKYSNVLDEHRQELDRYKTLAQGEKGDPGKAGKDVDENILIEKILAQIPPPKDAENKPVDLKGIISEVMRLLKDKTSEFALTTSDLKDIEPYTMRIKSSQNGFMFNGKRYKFEELMRGAGGGSGGGSITYSVDLSSQCNGINKTFTVPANTVFILLTGTDAPNIYRNGIDFTGTGTTTLTLTAGVNAPSLGATLILTYKV